MGVTDKEKLLDFNLSGPSHLKVIDWANPGHRRSIAASLVKGVNILGREHKHNRQGPIVLAPPWWKFFHFRLVRKLKDDKDLSIFGAVYELENPPPANNPPRYVIAFRGTVKTRPQDLKLDLRLIVNRLQKSPRFSIAMKCVQEIVASALPQNVWLAGHSLGSTLALCAGKNMVKDYDSCIETYLFNPPFPSVIETCLFKPVLLEEKKSSKINYKIQVAKSIITAGVAVTVHSLKQGSQEDEWSSLSNWVPYLFVNPNDLISSGYIGYFELRLKMMAIGDGSMGRLATQNSIKSLLSGNSSEPDHLLPSAYLGINMSPSESFKKAHGINHWWERFKKAHGINQWWEPNIRCEFKLYQWWDE